MAHHISATLLQHIQFGLFRFRSPLLAESLVDFSSSSYSDASLRTVRSPKLKHGSSRRDLIRKSWNQRSHAPTPGLSQLATSFIAYQAESSSNRRLCTSALSIVNWILGRNPLKFTRISVSNVTTSLSEIFLLIQSIVACSYAWRSS